MRNHLSLFVLFIFAAFCFHLSAANVWQHRVTNFTRHQYHAGTQNWMIEQQDNGWMYVANNKGLLEYDGVNWTLHPMLDTKMRALCKAPDGRIYAGGFTQLGYFEPDSLGMLSYHSLNTLLSDYPRMGVVRNVHATAKAVYFQTDRYLFIYSPHTQTLREVDVHEQIHTSALINHRLYVLSSGGLSVWNGSDFETIYRSPEMSSLSPVTLLPYRDELLIVTHSRGLFTYSESAGFRAMPTAADSFLFKNNVFCADLSGSTLALGSVQDGLCLLDLETCTTEYISDGQGLQNRTIISLQFDRDGNLWLALDNGIDFVHVNSPLRSLYGRRTVIGSGYNSTMFADRLYLGTNRGVFTTRLPHRLAESEPLTLVDGTGGQTWNFLQHDNHLFCATDNGVLMIDRNGRCNRLPGLRHVRCLVALKGNPDILVAGCYGVERGLHLLRKTSAGWKVDCQIDGCDVSCKSLLSTSVDSVLWVTNRRQGIYRVQLTDGFRRVANMKDYRTDAISYDHYTHLSVVDDEPLVVTRSGLWRYHADTDSLLRYRRLEEVLHSSGRFTYLYQDSLRNIWHSDGESFCCTRFDVIRNAYEPGGSYTVSQGSLIEDFEHVFICEGRAVIATEDGFDLFDSRWGAQSQSSLASHPGIVQSHPITLQVRRAYTTVPTDSLVWISSYLSAPIEGSGSQPAFVLPYRNNSLRLCCAATNYSGMFVSHYSFRLDRNGTRGVWTNFTESPIKEFSNLAEGSYTFHVRLDLSDPHFSNQSIESSVSFKILPPWYRTWWSILLYILTAMGVVIYIRRRVILGRMRLVKQQKLELMEQQLKFNQEQQQKDTQISTLQEEKLSLEEEKLQNELRHKSDELVRSTLNILRKNEMLTEIRKEVQSLSNSINEESLPQLRRRMLRLMGQISTNIEHDNDLQAFENSFDEVHHQFFAVLSARFPELTLKDKQLCAYLRMNLQSKEIAPLMNVSLRGVEISRYRLRAKLQLNSGENLTEFLQRIGRGTPCPTLP